jgi:hypothetical protein
MYCDFTDGRETTVMTIGASLVFQCKCEIG